MVFDALRGPWNTTFLRLEQNLLSKYEHAHVGMSENVAPKTQTHVFL